MWDGLKEATGYATQIWQGDDVTQTAWQFTAPRKSRSYLEIGSLMLGKHYRVRVRTQNTEDDPCSNPVEIFTP